MAILKTTFALSLAALISFGASGCSVNETTDIKQSSGSSSESTGITKDPSVAPESVKSVDTTKVEVVKSLNSLREIAATEKYKSLMEALKILGTGPMNEAEPLIDDHQELLTEIDSAMALSPEIIKEQQAYYMMSPPYGEGYNDKVYQGLMKLSAISGLMSFEEPGTNAGASYGIISDAISKEGESLKLKNQSIYLKDKNGAILYFLNFEGKYMTLEDGGKRIVVEGTEAEYMDFLDENSASDDPNVAGYDYNAFKKYTESYQSEGIASLQEYVDYLNGNEYGSDAVFEIVQKNGTDYVKVTDPETKITDEDEVLYVAPSF